MPKTPKETSGGMRRNEEKWTPTLMKAGWSIIPNIILERQKALGLEAMDINILLHLVRHWWEPGNMPFPAKQTIAECIGVDKSTIRRRIARMEAAGFIKREKRVNPRTGQQPNRYDLSGLIKEVTPYAKEFIDEQAARRSEDAQRRKRKLPKAGRAAAKRG